MTLTPALDRGQINSLAELRDAFSVENLENWRGFLVTTKGDLGLDLQKQTLWAVPRNVIETVPQLHNQQPWLMGQATDGYTYCVWMVDDSLAAELTEKAETLSFAPITQVGAELADDDALLGAQAVALARWHATDKYCTRCGQIVEIAEAGWASKCSGCGRTEYPRTDPAVIVLITDDEDRVLLAHNTAWANNTMSMPAGFIEAGETPRRAVAREIMEEVGVEVTDIEYLAAQPWPGPRSLMLAFSAKCARKQEPKPDEVEIDYARFFSREEYLKALKEGEIRAPRASAIANAVLADWLGKPLPLPQA